MEGLAVEEAEWAHIDDFEESSSESTWSLEPILESRETARFIAFIYFTSHPFC